MTSCGRKLFINEENTIGYVLRKLFYVYFSLKLFGKVDIAFQLFDTTLVKIT